MPKVINERLPIVGMYRYGNRLLPINSHHKLMRDRHNQYDVNAIKVVRCEDMKTTAYVARRHTHFFCTIFDDNLAVSNVVALKPNTNVKTIGRVPSQVM